MAAWLGKRKHESAVTQDESDGEEDDQHLTKKLFPGHSKTIESILKRAANSDSDSDDEEGGAQVVHQTQTSNAVWQDEDDEDGSQVVSLGVSRTSRMLMKTTDKTNELPKAELQDRLRKVYERIAGKGKTPTWAKIEQVDDEGSDDEVNGIVRDITRTAGRYIERADRLVKGIIDVRKLQDIAIGHRDFKSLTTVRFHRAKPVLITAGESGTVRLFQVDTEVRKEHFLQSVKLTRFPITSCEVLAGGNTLLLGSRSQHYFIKCNMDTNDMHQINLPKVVPKQNCGMFCASRDGSLLALVGNRGQVYLFTSSDMELLHNFSCPSPIVAIQFFPESNDEIWALTERGEVFIWSVQTKSQYSFLFEGAVKGTTFAIDNSGTHIAIGENSGFVSVFDIEEVRKNKMPKAKFTVSSLVTSISSIAFNHDGQLLAIVSSMKKGAIRLVHMLSGTTYQNFPPRQDSLPELSRVSFSPTSAYMCLGEVGGAIKLYRINAFEDY